MIIGTSHISISTFDIFKDISAFEERGFTLKFLDEKVENSSEKSLYLNNYSPIHSLAVLSGNSGIDIELVEHQSDEPDTQNKNIHIFFGEGSVESIEYKAQNFQGSLNFWEQFMAFSPIEIEKEGGFCILEKKAVFPQWRCKIQLTEKSEEFEEPKLDNRGATSFAFFTTNIKKELDVFHQKFDAKSTKTFEIPVNGKLLEIAMLSGPSKEIIELIEIKK